MRRLLLATACAVGLAANPANAALITAFAQTDGFNTVASTEAAGVTTFNVANAGVVLGGGVLGVIPGATMSLTATSIDAATLVAGNIVQHFSGNFCISSLVGCTGNFLKGTFTDAAFGAGGGPGLTVNVSNPPESLVLTSNVLPASELAAPNTFNLAFSGLSNPLSIVQNSIGGFTASFSGNISAMDVPEPATIALLGVGLLGLGIVARKRRPADLGGLSA